MRVICVVVALLVAGGCKPAVRPVDERFRYSGPMGGDVGKVKLLFSGENSRMDLANFEVLGVQVTGSGSDTKAAEWKMDTFPDSMMGPLVTLTVVVPEGSENASPLQGTIEATYRGARYKVPFTLQLRPDRTGWEIRNVVVQPDDGR